MSSERQLQVGAGTVPVQSRGGAVSSLVSEPPPATLLLLTGLQITPCHRAAHRADRQVGVVTTQRVLSVPGANRRMETGEGGGGGAFWSPAAKWAQL